MRFHSNKFKVKIGISHHRVADNGSISSEKKLVFLLDDIKPEKKKRKKDKKESGPTCKNFGARMDVMKMKSATKFIIGWRCRLLGMSSKYDSLYYSRAYVEQDCSCHITLGCNHRDLTRT